MKYKIIIPLFNDWEPVKMLIKQIEDSISDESLKKSISILIVNDCSTEGLNDIKFSSVFKIEILNLVRNLGHQRAICIGIAYVNGQKFDGNVIVMDADGEDKPSDIQKLIYEFSVVPNKIIFAKRKKRREGLVFKFFYFFYKISFHMLTGSPIGFGNFCLVPNRLLNNIAHVSEIWNHFSGGIIKSRIPYSTVSLDRGKRLSGKSKMNFVSLLLHGLSAISVHMDVVAIRLLLVALFFIVFSVFGVIVVVLIKSATNLAIPGWSSTLILTLLNIFLQSFVISLFLVFIVLYQRSQIQFIPSKNYNDYLENVTTI